MSRWKIKRDLGKEERKLATDTVRAANYASSEKKWSKNMGMMAALAVPMIVSTVFTGGAAMPLWVGMLAAGAGAAAGAKLGEEIAEAKEKGGIQLGEDKYSKGKGIREGKFLKSDRDAVKHSMVQNAKDLDSGMLKDAAVASVLYGVKVGGKDMLKSTKGMVKGAITGDETLKAASKSAFKDKMFGTAEQQAINADVFAAKKEKFAERMAGLKDGSIAKPDIDIQGSVGGHRGVLRNQVKRGMKNVSPEQRLKGRGAMKEWWDKVKPKGKVIGDETASAGSMLDNVDSDMIADAGGGEKLFELPVDVDGDASKVNLAAKSVDENPLVEEVIKETTPKVDGNGLRVESNDFALSPSKVKTKDISNLSNAQDYVNDNVNFELEDKLYDMFAGANNNNTLMSKDMWKIASNLFEKPKDENKSQGVV